MISLTQLPFSVDIRVPNHQQSCELEIVLLSPPPDDIALKDSQEALNLFATAANEQLFSSQTPLRPAPQMEPLSKTIESHGTCRRYLFRIQAIPPSAFLILLGLLAQTYYEGDPLQQVKIQTSNSLPELIETKEFDSLIRSSILPRIPNLPFLVENYYDEIPTVCSITFEFENKLEMKVFEELKEALEVWDLLVILGGFKFDFTEPEEFSGELGRTSHYTPTVVEHYLGHFDASESALNALINLGIRLHTTGYHLQMITFVATE